MLNHFKGKKTKENINTVRFRLWCRWRWCM